MSLADFHHHHWIGWDNFERETGPLVTYHFDSTPSHDFDHMWNDMGEPCTDADCPMVIHE